LNKPNFGRGFRNRQTILPKTLKMIFDGLFDVGFYIFASIAGRYAHR
jgi:hypothetical protein